MCYFKYLLTAELVKFQQRMALEHGKWIVNNGAIKIQMQYSYTKSLRALLLTGGFQYYKEGNLLYTPDI